MMRVVAIIGVRNGEAYLDGCVQYLHENGVSIIIIDNESSDATLDLIKAYKRAGLIENCVKLPCQGYFDLGEQLALKYELYSQLEADWVMHLDIDEFPHSPRQGETLVEAFERVEQAGWNAINFEEFVFLPVEAPYSVNDRGLPLLRHYYFFEPTKHRLMRAWKQGECVSNVETGGHRLRGDSVRIFPESFVLRHYPFLDQEHAYCKYIERRFNLEEIAKGWHWNRLVDSREQFLFPAVGELDMLEDTESHVMDRSRPRTKHYWDWKS